MTIVDQETWVLQPFFPDMLALIFAPPRAVLRNKQENQLTQLKSKDFLHFLAFDLNNALTFDLRTVRPLAFKGSGLSYQTALKELKKDDPTCHDLR